MKKQQRQSAVKVLSQPSSSQIKQYIPINKKVITEGEKINFKLYAEDEAHTVMSLFLQSDSMIDGNAKIRLHEIERLYIEEKDKEAYNEFITSHLSAIAALQEASIDDKVAIVYEKATETVAKMFENPDSLESYQEAKAIVSEFVENVFSDANTVASLLKITAHDYYTHTHSINVSIYAMSLGSFMGLSREDVEELGTSALLHDLGKSKVSAEIINKNGKLTDAEFAKMKEHPHFGFKIAQELGITDKRILSGIRNHHEKMDGKGYPDGLKAGEITLFARLIGVCDVFDALSTKRSYKDPMGSFEALYLMKTQMSTHLDMNIVNEFIKMLKQDKKEA
jgi:putative nucleotidyltransferase with HDIG domain